jgi:MFS family permease
VLRLLAGIGWAGTYMPGLKAIADPLERKAQSRAVSWHAAGSGSPARPPTIAGLVASWAGASASFLLGDATELSAVLIAVMVMPSALAGPVTKVPSRKLLDFRPVLRNRAAMGWIIGYTVHTWEIVGTARLGRHVPRRRWCQPGRAVVASRPDRALHDSD